MENTVATIDRRRGAPRRIACYSRACADWVITMERLEEGVVLQALEKVMISQ